MITVYKILKSEKFDYEWRDKNALGIIVAKTYREVCDTPPEKINQKEGGGRTRKVAAYPDEFKIVIINIIKDYLSKKAVKEKQLDSEKEIDEIS